MFENVKNCGAGKFISTKEWSHPDRIIDSYEIIFVTKGNVYINENGTEYTLKKDELLILQPGLRHYGFKSSANVEFFWLHWYGGPEVLTDIKHRNVENPYGISLYFRQLLDARVTKKTGECLDYLTRLVLIELYYNSKKSDIGYVAQRAAAWIDANSHAPITEKQLADTLGYNADYLNRLFKTSYSKSIKQYINDKRMEFIKGLMLCENLPLKEVAARTGFSEYKYFLKFFKYHEKITPTEFYKQYAKMNINTR